jgi:hypothetical protein
MFSRIFSKKRKSKSPKLKSMIKTRNLRSLPRLPSDLNENFERFKKVKELPLEMERKIYSYSDSKNMFKYNLNPTYDDDISDIYSSK